MLLSLYNHQSAYHVMSKVYFLQSSWKATRKYENWLIDIVEQSIQMSQSFYCSLHFHKLFLFQWKKFISTKNKSTLSLVACSIYNTSFFYKKNFNPFVVFSFIQKNCFVRKKNMQEFVTNFYPFKSNAPSVKLIPYTIALVKTEEKIKTSISRHFWACFLFSKKEEISCDDDNTRHVLHSSKERKVKKTFCTQVRTIMNERKLLLNF